MKKKSLITERKIFSRPLSDETFNSACECEDDYKASLEYKEKEEKSKSESDYRSNFIRLNASSVDEVRSMIEEYSAKWWGADIKFSVFDFRFSHSLSITHNAPIGVETDWHCKRNENHAGFSGGIQGKMKKTNQFGGISDFFRSFGNGVRAFHMGGGSCGCDFRMSAQFFIQDYPLIQKNYEKYLDYKSKFKVEEANFNKKQQENLKKNSSLFNSDEKAILLQEHINDLEVRINELEGQRSEIRNDIFQKNKLVYPRKYSHDAHPELTKIFGSFLS